MNKILLTLFLSFSVIIGQESNDEKKEPEFTFSFEPDSLFLKVGEEATVEIRLKDKNGKLAQNPFYVYGRPRRSLESSPRISDSTGYAKVTIKAYKPGKLQLSTRSISQKREDRIYGSMKVEVPNPPLDRIVFNDPKEKIYVGTTIKYPVSVFDIANLERDDIDLNYSSSNTSLADFDDYGNLTVSKPGNLTITVTADDIKKTLKVKLLKNPVAKISLKSKQDEIRTGDVIQFEAKALNRSGKEIKDAPINFSYRGKADYGIGLPASALIENNGKFVAETSGIFTVLAQSGGFSAQKTIKVVPRNVGSKIKVIGHGTISDVHTSDLWVWPGIGKHEGKDFAVTGTWSANGEAYFWDVSDPTDMKIIDTVTVDARTVNDVKISEDGKVGVITREGASNRKNGLLS